MSLFNELKRRNVFRVGIAYLIAAWLIMQVADVILNNIEAPGWVFQAILLVLAIGLPLILLFAWAFEMTPEGLKREKDVDRSQSITPHTGKKLDRVIIGVMAIALAYFAYDKFKPDMTEPAEPVAASAGTQASESADSEKSIAVLPLANRSNREEDQFFTDGIHDDLLTQLAKIADLKVISRTSVMRYRDTELSIPEIAQQLGVSTILEGGIQRSGDQVRINMQLIEAATDKHLWAETYDRKLTAENLFAIQSEIAHNITAALEAQLTPEESARIEDRPTQSLEAFQEYMLGQQQIALRTAESIEAGKAHFEAALALDPEFKQATVGLANALHLGFEYIGWPKEESLDVAMELLNGVLADAPDLGEAYMVRGELFRHEQEFDLAEADFERALKLIPGNATVYHWFSFVRSQQGRREEAQELLQKAHRLDPMSRVIHGNVAQIPFYEGKDEEALAEMERVRQLHPDYPFAYANLAWVHEVHGDLVEALRNNLKVVELDPNSTHSGLHCFDYFGLGAMEATRQCVEDYDGPASTRRMLMAVLLKLAAGDSEAAKQIYLASGDLAGGDGWRVGAGIATRQYEFPARKLREWYPDWFDEGSPGTVGGDDLWGAINAALVMQEEDKPEQAAALLKAALQTMDGLARNRGAENIGYADIQAYALLGMREPALAALGEVAEMGYLQDWQGLKFMPFYDSIRDDPRFDAAVQRLAAAAEEQRKKAVQQGLL